MAEDLISSDHCIIIVTFFPGFLEKPSAAVMLLHHVHNIIKFGKVWMCIDDDITSGIAGVAPEASCIL